MATEVLAGAGPPLQFARFQSLVDEGFWWRFSSLKLDTLGIDQSPLEISGFYAPCSHPQVSNHLSLISESLDLAKQPSLTTEISRGNRNRCAVPGTLYNTNTLNSFHELDRERLLMLEAKKIIEDIQSGKAEEDSAVLSRFIVISFADLKKWSFWYWFAFPALVIDPPATFLDLRPASEILSKEEAESLSSALKDWRNSSTTTDIPFFLAILNPKSGSSIRPLRTWEHCQSLHQKLFFGFYDPCHLPNNPGWPLRNFLTFISLRWKLEKVSFLCYRERHGLPNLELSLIGEAEVKLPQGFGCPGYVPKPVGWEFNRGKLAPKCISLSESMDPERLAVSAADLNLKLMRWRALPSLNLDSLSSVKCLLLGAGTLGCQVARMLMAWGVRQITFVDSGRVSMSNPVRQSLYTFEDCLNGGELKALAAARSLKRIFPAVEAEGIVMAIPMPGHPIADSEMAAVIEECHRLDTLIASHDVVFMLTDTRESRWLPTLLCTAHGSKIAINAALGFESFLVMRYGTDVGRRLGCYFCNDVVAPIDSTSNRTLDQQCTVTRPGLAPIASSLAVELMVGILHHPNGICAPAEVNQSSTSNNEQPLGIVPHQIRGSLSQFSQMALVGYSSSSCTACCDAALTEYKTRGMDFVVQAINDPMYLEDLTGLTELKAAATSFSLDWDADVDDDDNNV